MRLVDAAAEEDQLELAAAVRDGHFEALAGAAVELQDAGARDLGDHGDVLVEGQVGEAGELAALRVSARIVVEQVTDRVQA